MVGSACAQNGDAKQAPAAELDAGDSSARPPGRGRKKATCKGKQNGEPRCREPDAACAEQPEKKVDLLLAAAIAAEQKPGAGGKKSGAKMLRLLQDSAREDQRAEREVRAVHVPP